jgi:hypothetical protein
MEGTRAMKGITGERSGKRSRNRAQIENLNEYHNLTNQHST